MSSLRSPYAQELLTVSEASNFANVSIATIRNWDADGEIETTRTVGGHRRVIKSSLLKALGLGTENKSRERFIFCYVRVSSKKQKQAGSLDRQRKRMVEYVRENFGLEEHQVRIIEDVASAFGRRPGLQKLADAIIGGEVSHVIAEHQDRLSRVGSELRLLEHLAETYGTQLVYAKQTIEESDQNYMVRELIDFVTVICNRISSKKAAMLARFDVSEEVLERTTELLEEGHGLTAVVPKLREEGFTATVNGESKKLTYSVLRKRMLERFNMNQFQQTIPNPASPVVANFVKDRCTVGNQEREWSDVLFDGYVEWARENSTAPLKRRGFAEQIKLLGMKSIRSTKSRRRWIGLSLNRAD